jgi:ribosomal-protein-alanine N-acetyltransferase
MMIMGTDKETKINTYKKDTESKPYNIRKCTFEDLESVKEVNEAELPEDYPFFFYKSILDNYPDSFLVACLKDNPNQIIGYVMWRIERTPAKDSLRFISNGHLVSIAVSKAYRRLGIATELLKRSMPEIKKFHITEYVLEVRISNHGAINLYQNFNFNSEGIRKKYYRDGENAYYMVLKVTED